ncbi:hypothetical protein [uncultured Hyphomicrobium sp.]|uniref:hypothetical protein n=1 Tax=uncultured Hyphomicrobium sp. TaxID=194373 RepID=UPI0025E72124|nr:hypothetical protein [uncultured Hyphomicrobium sp.]
MRRVGCTPRNAAAATIVLLTACPGATRAAVRICEDPVSSGPVVGSNEETARAAALAVWKSKALEHGEPYASWRIAADKLLKCLPRDGGGVECLATARPCTIEQAPDRRENRKNRIGI